MAHDSSDLRNKLFKMVSQIPQSHLAEPAAFRGDAEATTATNAAAPTSTDHTQLQGIHS